MKFFREFTKKQFIWTRRLFLGLTIFGIIHFTFLTKSYLSSFFSLMAFIIVLTFTVLMVRHDLYDGKYKDDLES